MRRPYKKRYPDIKPDKKYKSLLVSKLINYVLRDGKKSVAEKIVYKAMEQASLKLKKPAIKILEQAVENVKPSMEVRSRRIGGATYQVPTEVRSQRRIILALRWITQAARNKQGKSTDFFLAQEIINAYNMTGDAVAKKEDMHKAAEANKAFAHFARY